MTELAKKIRHYRLKGYKVPAKNMIKNQEQLDGIKESGKINIELLDYITEHICEGITTEEIDRLIHERTLSFGAVPAPLGYHGFPKSTCVSVDEVVCHGIPNENQRLKEGDIVNVDVSTIYNKFFSDSSRMFTIGSITDEKAHLVETARICLEKGIEQVKPWTPIGNVGAAIKAYAESQGCSVVREIGGHGVGCEFHEEPFVSHVSQKNTGVLLVPGMVFTIEPMVNLGSEDVYQDIDDGWTIRTTDGKPSAQWEKMVCVTEDGFEVLAW